MQFLFVALVISLLGTLFILRSARLHAAATGDRPAGGPQKLHRRVVPRVGGVAIALGILGGVALGWVQQRPYRLEATLLAACALPAFAAGLAEDLTKRVRVLSRLLATMVSAALAAWLFGSLVTRTDIGLADTLLAWNPMPAWGVPPVAWLFTVIAVAGLANAVNIIDGLNGLASMTCVMMFGSVCYVALQVGDAFIIGMSLMMVGAIAGFFIFNFPAGLVFLGDGGAYLLGFMLAECAVLLVARHPQVSPWYPILLLIYPVFETVFSVYRRRLLRGRPIGSPDGVHLHSLAFRRLLRWMIGPEDSRRASMSNSVAAAHMWVLCALAVLPATVFWHSTAVLAGGSVLFCVSYVWIYSRIVRFRTPGWLRMSQGD